MGTVKRQEQIESLTTLVNLSPEDVRRLAKPRGGFEVQAPQLIALYAAHLDALGIKDVSPELLTAELQAYQALQQTEASTRAQLHRVQETRALRGASVWSSLLDIYARAQAVGRNDAEVLHGIADFERYMKLGPRKKPVATPVKPTGNSEA